MNEYKRGMPADEMSGMRFGRLVVIRPVSDGRRNGLRVRCDCGIEKTVARNHLVGGRTKSCGCLKPDSVRRTHTTHGMSHSKIYWVWAAMVNRATVSKNKNYAVRGISVCEKWKTFSGFYEDMGPSFSEGLSIERIDNDGNYCPENCMWADRATQAKNKRTSLRIVLNGSEINLTEACRKMGAKYITIRHRIYMQGMSPEEAFSCKRQ